MNALATLAGPLRALPPVLRKTLYSLLTAVGGVLAVCVSAGVDKFGSVRADTLLQAFAYLSAALGVVAVSNVDAPEEGGAAVGLLDFDDDLDMSSFEPVQDEGDVFAEAVD